MITLKSPDQQKNGMNCVNGHLLVRSWCFSLLFLGQTAEISEQNKNGQQMSFHWSSVVWGDSAHVQKELVK